MTTTHTPDVDEFADIEIASLKRERRESAEPDYQELVTQLADGADVEPEVATTIVHLAGRTFSDLARDAISIVRLRGSRQVSEAAFTAAANRLNSSHWPYASDAEIMSAYDRYERPQTDWRTTM